MSPWHRMKEAEREATSVVDVDGSYLHRKYKALADAGQEFARPPHPSCPISGWRSVTEDTYHSIAPSITPVTSGMVHAGLQHGFIVWSQILYTIPHIQAWCTHT